MRLFIAIDMPAQVIELAEQIQHHLKSLSLFKGPYTKPNGMHITLKFLGDVDDAQVLVVQETLRTVRYPALKATVGAVDTFMHNSRIKVIFLHIICPELTGLVHLLDDLLPTFPKEERDFMSHLTLARVKGVDDRDALLRALNAIEVPRIEFQIKEFALKKSELTADGSVYNDVMKFALEE